MTGMDMLLASLTREQLEERSVRDAADFMAETLARMEADYMRWIIEDLEKRIRE